MPKQKTSSTAKKRMNVKKSGKVKCYQQNRRHILTKKSSKRKMRLRRSSYVSKADERNVKKLLNKA